MANHKLFSFLSLQLVLFSQGSFGQVLPKSLQIHPVGDKEKKTVSHKSKKVDAPENISFNGNANPKTVSGTTDRDGNNYGAVKLGSQIWMSANLNVSQFRNGDLIHEIKDATEWLEAGIHGQPAWCYFENKADNGIIYGKLYNWWAVCDVRGLAPEGWHIPTFIEWSELAANLGGKSIAGGKLKSKTGWGIGYGTNESGLSCLPGGFRTSGKYFISGFGSWWWYSEGNGGEISVRKENSGIEWDPFNKDNGNSIRCIRD